MGAQIALKIEKNDARGRQKVHFFLGRLTAPKRSKNIDFVAISGKKHYRYMYMYMYMYRYITCNVTGAGVNTFQNPYIG